MPSDSGPPKGARGSGKLTRETAKAIGRKGGHAKAAARKMMDSLGLLELEKDSTFTPYKDFAESYRKGVTAQFIERFGHVDALTLATIGSGCLQLGASRHTFGKAAGHHVKTIGPVRVAGEWIAELVVSIGASSEEFLRGSRLAADARASLDAAWERCESLEKSKPKPGAGNGAPQAPTLPPWMAPA